MSNTKHKLLNLFDRKQAWYPSKEKASGNNVLEGFPARNIMASQDNSLAQGARSVFDLNAQGARDFLATSSIPTPAWDGVAGGLSGTLDQLFPEPDVLRTIGNANFTMTPGCYLRARVLCMDSGETQGQGWGLVGSTPTLLWWNSGSYGELVLSCSFDNSNGFETVVKRIVLPASQHPSGTLNDNAWKNFRTRMIAEIMPPEIKTDKEQSEIFSELTTVKITVQERGSPRLVHLNITEVPLAHTHQHDEGDDSSAHAYIVGNQIPPQVATDYPQTDELDGPDFEEKRFGTFQTLDAMNNQIERLGPSVLNWSAWNHKASKPNTENMELSITQNMISVPDLLYTSWTLNKNGWINPSANAQKYAVNTGLKNKRAVMPVHIRIRACVDGVGRVRAQSCEHSFYEFTISGDGSNYVWYKDTAYLEGGLGADDMQHNLQLFLGKETSHTFTVTDMQIIFGDYALREYLWT